MLLLGSNGFVGSKLKKALYKKFKLYSPSSKVLNLRKKADLEKYFSKNKLDVVVNCAWNINSKSDNALIRNNNKKNNILISKNLYEVVSKSSTNYFINLSSINIYKESVSKVFETKIFEKDYLSSNPESSAKKILIKKFQNNNRFKCVNLILTNLYGYKNNNKNNLFIDKVLKNIFLKKNYTIHYSFKNHKKINFLYIDDAINGICFFIKKLIENKLRHKNINICSEKNYNLNYVFKQIQILSKRKIKYKEKKINNRSILPSNYLAKKYGWTSKIKLSDGLRKTIKIYKSHL